MRERLISIDAGGTMTKAAVFDLQGNELARECRRNVTAFSKPGYAEWDPDAIWGLAADAIRCVLETSGTAPETVAAITPSGFGAGIFFVDGQGDVVRRGVMSTDGRALSQIATWRDQGLIETLEELVGQETWPGQSLAILGWMARHEPETLKRTKTLLWCKDFLRLRLCGDRSTDFTDAGCSGLMSLTQRTYALDALTLAGIGDCADKLPPIGPCDAVVGGVSRQAALQTGLLEGTPVVRGVYDVVGCSLASGLQSQSQLGIVAGTFSINSTLHRAPTLAPLPTLQAPYPIDDLYLATTASPTSASNLEWICKTFLSAEAEKALAQGTSIYDVCGDLVASSAERDDAPFFFPYLISGPKGALGGLLGARNSDGLGDVLRAVFEGIIFAHRRDIIRLLVGPQAQRPDTIRLAGGASKSDVWAAMFSDAIGLPVEITNGSEFGAKGGAICAASAIGAQENVEAATRTMTHCVRRYDPNPARRDLWDSRYQRFKTMSDHLADFYAPPAVAPSARVFQVGDVA
jgi:L-xylulokinase